MVQVPVWDTMSYRLLSVIDDVDTLFRGENLSGFWGSPARVAHYMRLSSPTSLLKYALAAAATPLVLKPRYTVLR